MDTKKELKILLWVVIVFAAVFFMPLGSERFMTAVDATLDLTKWVCAGTCRIVSAACLLHCW